jgi:hypothetical protein
MNNICQRICEWGVSFLKKGAIKYLVFAILTPILLAIVAIQQQVVPPASVVRDAAIYMTYFAFVAAMTWAYARYIDWELHR